MISFVQKKKNEPGQWIIYEPASSHCSKRRSNVLMCFAFSYTGKMSKKAELDFVFYEVEGHCGQHYCLGF